MTNPLEYIKKWLPSPVLSGEEKILRRGRKVMEATFEEQKSYGLSLQSRFDNLTNEHLLTGALPFRDDIPQKYRDKLDQFRKRIKEIIFGIAAQIQDQKFSQLDSSIRDAGLTMSQEKRYIQIRDSSKQIYASYDAIRESLKYINDFNQHILSKITQTSGRKKTDLLLLNAIIVHELTDTIIELVEEFQLNGKETLRSINQQIIEDLRAQEKADNDLWTRTTMSEGKVQAMVQKSINERIKIRNRVVDVWEKLWERVAQLESNISHTRGHLSTLKLIRDNARGQINILEVIGITQIVESNIRNFQEMCEVTNIELAPLSQEDVFNLIGGSNATLAEQ